MAQRLEELQTEGGVGIQSAGWLIASLLESESTDRHVRSIRYQMGAARFPVHRDLASFDFTKSKVDEALIRQLPGIRVLAEEEVADEAGLEIFATLGPPDAARAA